MTRIRYFLSTLVFVLSVHGALANIEIDDGGTTIENSNLGTVSGNLIVKSNSTYILNGNITELTGNIEVEDGSTLIINGDILEMGGSLVIDGDLTVSGSITASGKLEVKGNGETTLDGGSFASTGSDVVIESGGILNLDNMSSITVPGGNSVTNNGTINADNTGNTINGSVTGGGTVDPDLGDCSSGCSDASLLPIELLYFEAQIHGHEVLLKWASAVEIDNDYYTLERSFDGQTFERIAEVRGAGNSKVELQYELKDHPGTLGLIYYRLSQTDFDGQFEIFPVISTLYQPNGNVEFKVFPTVLKSGEQVQIEGLLGSIETVAIRLISTSGLIIKSPKVVQEVEKLFVATDHLSTGVYMLKGVVNGIPLSSRIVLTE